MKRGPGLALVLVLVGALLFGAAHQRLAVAAGPLTHGPVVGALTHSSARVWFRLAVEAAATVRWGRPDLAGASEVEARLRRAPDGGWVATADLAGLEPDSVYHYQVVVGRRAVARGPVPRLRTLPSPGSETPFRFCLASCQSRAPVGGEAFDRMADLDPLFVIQAGDFGYPNSTDERVQAANYLAQYDPAYGLSRLLRRAALYHVWDDHDFGGNNVDGTVPGAEVSRRLYSLYASHLPLACPGGAIAQSFVCGRSEFFLLDTRSRRLKGVGLLDGLDAAEWSQRGWLLEGLERSTARWKFVVSSVPLHPVLGNREDSWCAFPEEREALIRDVRDHTSGVIFLTGDRHTAMLDDGTNSGLPEINSGAVDARPRRAPRGSYSHGALETAQSNFALVEVGPEAVRASIRSSDDGATLLEMAVPAP